MHYIQIINTCTRDIPFRTGKSKEEQDALKETIAKTCRKAYLAKWRKQALLGTARRRKGPGKGRTVTSLGHHEGLVDLRKYHEED